MEKEPSGVDDLSLPEQVPLFKTPTGCAGPFSSSNTLTHVHQATYILLVQDEDPALSDRPTVVVTPGHPA